MEKKGLIGKIFLAIGIIILIIGIIIGFTVWQVYNLYKTVQEEKTNIDANVALLQKGDCSKLPAIEASMQKIITKAKSTCKNSIIAWAVGRMSQIPYKCAEVSGLESQMSAQFQPIKDACAKMTNMTASKLQT